MDHIQAPALLAYRGGEVFTTITDIIRNIPKGRSCSADSLEDLLKLYVVISKPNMPMIRILICLPGTVCFKWHRHHSFLHHLRTATGV